MSRLTAWLRYRRAWHVMRVANRRYARWQKTAPAENERERWYFEVNRIVRATMTRRREDSK